MMQQDNLVTLPAEKENSVAQRTEFPKIILYVLDVGYSCPRSGKRQNLKIFINLFQLDAAVLAGIGGVPQGFNIFLDRLSSLDVLIEVDFVQGG